MRLMWLRSLAISSGLLVCGSWHSRRLAVLTIVLAASSGCDARGSVSEVTAAPEQGHLEMTPTGVVSPEPVLTAVTLPPINGHPEPVRTREIVVGSEKRTIQYHCGPASGGRLPNVSWDGLLTWSVTSPGILFGYDGWVWLAHEVTGEIFHVIDVNPLDDDYDLGVYGVPDIEESGLWWGYYASISPSGDRLAYTSCEFFADVPAGGRYPGISQEMSFDANYEIVIGDLDPGEDYSVVDNERITESDRVDHYPVWSPDGTRIAFLSTSDDPGRGVRIAERLNMRRTDGSDKNISLVARRARRGGEGGLAMVPPVWSPDSKHLSYYGIDGDHKDNAYILYANRIASGWDGSEIGRVKATSLETRRLPLATWSPDSGRIAFVAGEEDGRGLFTALPDGTDRKLVVSDPEIRQVEWSPEGEEILVVSEGIYFIKPDGSDQRRLEAPRALRGLLGLEGRYGRGSVAWSPDGARIAIHNPGTLLVTMRRDGTDRRILYEGHLQPPVEEPVDPAVCSAGLVVPEPKANPGLVRDCETLLAAFEAMGGRSRLRWSGDVTIGFWHGVVLHGSPARVVVLALQYEERTLRYTGLTGSIPPELGDLQALMTLSLSGNQLSGEIPAELGKLAELTALYLDNTNLSGSIPAELANLKQLKFVNISNTQLTGCIPREFSEIWVTGSDLERCKAASDQ